MSSSVLNSVSLTVTFEDEEPSNFTLETTNSELESVRKMQSHVNELITEKISQLKAENKLTEVAVFDEDSEECDTESDE